MQSFNHRGIYLIVYKHAHGLGSRGEAHGFLIQMRLEKTQFVAPAIRRVEKFAVVVFCAKDCDFHRLISASHFAPITAADFDANIELRPVRDCIVTAGFINSIA